jgi:hypothetical protein
MSKQWSVALLLVTLGLAAALILHFRWPSMRDDHLPESNVPHAVMPSTSPANKSPPADFEMQRPDPPRPEAIKASAKAAETAAQAAAKIAGGE